MRMNKTPDNHTNEYLGVMNKTPDNHTNEYLGVVL